MELEQLATNRALQEHFVEGADDHQLKMKVYEVLDFANTLVAELSVNYSEQLEAKQNLALRCCFFFLNQLGERRLKRADLLQDTARDSAFQSIKDDFELVLGFTRQPQDMDAYFFKCQRERIFEIAVVTALSFMGGNPAIERVESGAEEARLKCFEIMMKTLDLGR